MNDWRLKENGVKMEKKPPELKLGNSAKRRELRLEVELEWLATMLQCSSKVLSDEKMVSRSKEP